MDIKSMSLADKVKYIKETIATMMDVQPITCVGQEHPAKKANEKKHAKEAITETSKVTDYDAYKGRKDAVEFAKKKLDVLRHDINDKYRTDDPATVRKVTSDRTKLEANHLMQDYYDKKNKLDKNVELFKNKHGHHPERTVEKTFSKFYDKSYTDQNHDNPEDTQKKLEKAYKAKAHVDELHNRAKRAKENTCKKEQTEKAL
jgi:hypothetical protein